MARATRHPGPTATHQGAPASLSRAPAFLPSPVLARPLQIGPVRLETNLLLAPIAGYCDLAWRLACREQGGVGLACTDLLSPHGLLRGNAQSLDLARTCDADKPVGMQLYGADPALMADGAKWAVDHGATVVDINMGCPVDKVTKKDGGSKLMCDLTQATRLAQAVRAALPDHIPLTCKMRLGWDEPAYDADCAPTLALRLIGIGVAAITVHGRTTEMRFKGQCRRPGIKRVVDAVAEATNGSIPVIGNGDVRTPQDCAQMIEQTGCAGVMIGRGSLSAPWIFRDCWHYQLHGAIPPPPSEEHKLQIIRTYFDRMHEYRGPRYALVNLKSRISWLGKEINGSHCRWLKDSIRAAESPADVHTALDAWLAGEGRDPHARPDPATQVPELVE